MGGHAELFLFRGLQRQVRFFGISFIHLTELHRGGQVL
jgi:hypothetical protein